MTNRFYAGQTNYIEEMNALDGETGDHIADTTGAHAATAISNTPAGNIAATTVQAAINELDTEKLSASATTLPASFTASSLTSVGTLTALTVSGQASFAAGSAAAPSVRVGAEQNGLYSSAANTLDVTLNGVRSFQFLHAASAVNRIQASPSATGFPVALLAAGNDTNISFGIYGKGSGTIFNVVRGSTALLIDNPASAVNYWSISGSAAGGFSNILEALGTDANIQNLYASKGTSGHVFRTGSSAGFTQFLIGNTTNAVNYAQITGSATGLSVVYGAGGSDTHVQTLVTSKGAGNVAIYTGTGASPVLFFTHTASAANYWLVTGAVTGGFPTLAVSGSDTNVNAGISTKGTGGLGLYTNSANTLQVLVSNTTSAVNYLNFTGAATGNAVTISTGGSDTNRDIAITPGGAGVLRFGTHSAIAAETVTGYITVKDSAGNTRKLAVLS